MSKNPSSELSTSEERVFEAALRVFARKGRDGARMQEIADEAQINRAMLHYYFRSKQDLYARVFDHVLGQFVRSLAQALDPAETTSFADALRAFIDTYMDFVGANTDVLRLMMTELLAGGDVIRERIQPYLIRGETPPQQFVRRIEKAIEQGEIAPVHPQQLLVTVVSGCVFAFVAFPIVTALIPEAAENRAAFIEARKEHLFTVLYRGLQVRTAT